MTRWLTPPQIARLLGVEPPKVRTWVQTGELVACDVSERQGGRPRWRVAPEALEAFLRRRQCQASPPARRQRKASRSEVPEYV